MYDILTYCRSRGKLFHLHDTVKNRRKRSIKILNERQRTENISTRNNTASTIMRNLIG